MPFVVLLGDLPLASSSSCALRSGAGESGLLGARGIPGRGLVLSAQRTATEASSGAQRFEVRSIVLDVEVPGKPPYEVSLSAMIPRICEALPGAAFDLRVDPANPNNLAVVGPAGSSQWLGAAAAIPGQTWAVAPGASRSGCGTIVIVLVALSLAFGAFVSFFGGPRDEPAPEPMPTHVPRPAPSPLAPPAPVASALHRHPQCDAAVRCCETMGLPLASCQAFASETEAACTSALLEERKAALKMGKRCP